MLVSAAAYVFLGQKLDAPAVIEMMLIIVGVSVMNVLSKAGAH